MKKFGTKDNRLTTRARKLRVGSTDAELKLWYRLRNRQLEGIKFRRQHPIAGYVLDFACEELRLGIELDGSQHMDPMAARYDMRRTHKLNEHGWVVLRFWNNEVLEQTEGVLVLISEAVRTVAPHPPRDRIAPHA